MKDAGEPTRGRRSIDRRKSIKQIAAIAAASALPFWLPRLSSFAPRGTEAQPVPSESQLARMDEIASQYMTRYKVPGTLGRDRAAWAVCLSERIRICRCGSRRKSSRRKICFESPASAAKPITSVTIFTLIEKGRLKLSDRVFGPDAVLGTDFGSRLSRARAADHT